MKRNRSIGVFFIALLILILLLIGYCTMNQPEQVNENASLSENITEIAMSKRGSQIVNHIANI